MRIETRLEISQAYPGSDVNEVIVKAVDRDAKSILVQDARATENMWTLSVHPVSRVTIVDDQGERRTIPWTDIVLDQRGFIASEEKEDGTKVMKAAALFQPTRQQ